MKIWRNWIKVTFIIFLVCDPITLTEFASGVKSYLLDNSANDGKLTDNEIYQIC